LPSQMLFLLPVFLNLLQLLKLNQQQKSELHP
jgi:hypothetical protein